MNNRFFPFVLSSSNRSTTLKPMNSLAAVELVKDVNDQTPIDQQLVDAFNSNNAVMAYVIGVDNTSLPVLPVTPPQPAWYTEFLSSFSDVKKHSQDWTNSIAPSLISIPTGIVNYGYVFNINMLTINAALEVLKTNPQDSDAQNKILTNLNNLLNGLNVQLQGANNLQVVINNFASNLTSDESILQAAVNSAQSSSDYDQDQVAELMADVANLQNKISTWQTVIGVAAVGAALSLFAGAVIAVFTFGAGLAIGIIGGAAGIALIIAGNVEIKQLTNKINADNQSMNNLNQQIASLTTVLNNVKQLITLSQAASQQVQLVIEAWTTMTNDITAVINDLQSAESSLSSDNIVSLQAEINSANSDWQQLSDFCSNISKIQYVQATPATAPLPSS